MRRVQIVPDSDGGGTFGADIAPEFVPLQQSPAYGAALAALGAGVARLAIRDGDATLGVAQVISRGVGPFRLSLISRGPVWATSPGPAGEGTALGLIARAIARDRGVLVATGVAARGRGLPLAGERAAALLDLAAKPEVLRARAGAKWRNRLVRAEAARLFLRTEVPTPSEVAAVLTTDAAQQRLRGYRSLPAAFTHAWLARDPKAALLVEARAQGVPVAWMFFLLHAPTASYHIGWTGVAGRQLNAHNLVLWHAMVHLHAAGYRTLDLGTVDSRAAPGIARFKLGAGAQVTPLGPTRLILPSIRLRS